MKTNRKTRSRRGGALSDILPITSWGTWSNYPGALAWSPTSQAPPPLANGGLYNTAQSTGPWASSPFPATQYAMAVAAADTARNPAIFYQQTPAYPFVGLPASSQHYSSTMAVKSGGKRKKRRMTKRRK